MTPPAGAPAAKIKIAKRARTLLASSSIEWYAFFIYGTAAALVFPKLFFAASLPPYIAQIAAFSTFAVGFIARPVGGVVFGHFGDRLGRKRALVTALLIMGVASTLLRLLPSYKTIGVAAAVLLIVLLFAQMGVPAGVVLANLIVLIMSSAVSPDAFLDWGWRVPFVLSLALVGLGLYVQLRLEDTADYQALQALEAKKHAEAIRALASEKSVSLDKARAILRAEKTSPILQVIARHPREILLAAGSFVAANGTFYVIITYSISYATKVLHPAVPRSTILWAVLLGSLISAPFLPLLSALSDRIGRRNPFLTGPPLARPRPSPFFLLLHT